MYKRVIIGISIILVITAIYGLPSRSKEKPAQTERLQIDVVSTQLPSESGVVPVELRCDKAELSSPNSLEKLSCVIKNNTHKLISAGATYTSFSLERNGETFVSSKFETFDTFLHSDFRDTHRDNLILPGGETRFSDLPVSYDEGIKIKAVTVAIDYIEFSDSTSLGNNRAGGRMISEARHGAAIYKEWLAKKYEETGSLNAIVRLLDQDMPAQELKFDTESAEHGANMYRNFARRTYKSRGAEALIQQLISVQRRTNEDIRYSGYFDNADWLRSSRSLASQ